MTNVNEDLELALVEAALEDTLRGVSPPDLSAAVLARAGSGPARDSRSASSWRWMLVAAATLVCGAAFGSWWRGRKAEDAHQATAPGEPQDQKDASDEFYRPRDVADARRVLERVDAPDVQLHFVGTHRLPTDSVMGPPAPTLALGRWGLGKALAMAMRRALEEARPAVGFDAAARPHTIFVGADDKKRMRLAVVDDVLWVDGLGGFTAKLGDTFAKRLRETEVETRHALGIVHREELGAGLPNELIPAEQATLRPFGLGADDVRLLAGLKSLRTLDLRWCAEGHTAAVLQQVAMLPSVRELRVSALTDATLSIVAGMRLERLLALRAEDAPWRPRVGFSGKGVTDASIDELLRLSDLQTLVLPWCGLSRPGVARLAGLPSLRQLVLPGLMQESRSSVWDAFAAHANLTELRISGRLLWKRDLADLARLPALEELTLDGCWGATQWYPSKGPSIASEKAFRNQQKAFRNQENADRLHLADLRFSPKLRRLSLGRWFPAESRPIDDATRSALVAVASIPTLRWLDLSDCPGLGATDILALGDAKQLDTIVLCGTAGDAPGLIPIQAVGPLLDAIPGLSIVTH